MEHQVSQSSNPSASTCINFRGAPVRAHVFVAREVALTSNKVGGNPHERRAKFIERKEHNTKDRIVKETTRPKVNLPNTTWHVTDTTAYKNSWIERPRDIKRCPLREWTTSEGLDRARLTDCSILRSSSLGSVYNLDPSTIYLCQGCNTVTNNPLCCSEPDSLPASCSYDDTIRRAHIDESEKDQISGSPFILRKNTKNILQFWCINPDTN